jgi:hypothetical protein
MTINIAKTQKTKDELQEILMNRCIQLPIQSVMIFPNDQYGWTANFMASPNLLAELQVPFDAIVRELRAQYDLKR